MEETKENVPKFVSNYEDEEEIPKIGGIQDDDEDEGGFGVPIAILNKA